MKYSMNLLPSVQFQNVSPLKDERLAKIYEKYTINQYLFKSL